MIKENQKYLNRLQIVLDILIVIVSFIAAYSIRFLLMEGIVSISLRESLQGIVYFLPVYVFLYYIFQLYTPARTSSVFREFGKIIRANAVGALIFILALYLLKLIDFSRIMLVFFVILNTSLMIVERGSIRYILRRYRRKGYNQKHCIVIGRTDLSEDFFKAIKRNPQWGYQIIGYVDDDFRKKDAHYKYLGTTEELNEILLKYYADIVIIALNEKGYHRLGAVIAECEKAGVKTNIIPYYYRYVPANPYIDDLDGMPVIDTRHVPLDNHLKNFAKRSFDIVFALLAILLTSPVMIFSVIMIKMTSPGPVIYKQERVGLNRKPFHMYKFRSMKVQKKEEEKRQWTVKDDPRKTKWGSFMRKTSIDELPQFVNVLKGEMSVIGPRPERPYFVEKFKEEIPKYMIKHQVRPGITGWAQVNGLRGDTSIEERIRYDLYYIENWTFALDIKIVIMTVFKGLVNRNAY